MNRFQIKLPLLFYCALLQSSGHCRPVRTTFTIFNSTAIFCPILYVFKACCPPFAYSVVSFNFPFKIRSNHAVTCGGNFLLHLIISSTFNNGTICSHYLLHQQLLMYRSVIVIENFIEQYYLIIKH